MNYTKQAYQTVAEALQSGAIGVCPTDTVYGLVARASDEAAVARLYDAKPREGKPGTLVAANIDQLVELGLTRRYMTAVTQYWPGPISVIIPVVGTLEYLHLGLQGLAVRLPDDAWLQKLLAETGPLLTTSANETGQPTATTVAAAKAYFDDRIDFYVDGGDLSGHQPSTLIRVVDDAIEVLRQGAVHISDEGDNYALIISDAVS